MNATLLYVGLGAVAVGILVLLNEFTDVDWLVPDVVLAPLAGGIAILAGGVLVMKGVA